MERFGIMAKFRCSQLVAVESHYKQGPIWMLLFCDKIYHYRITVYIINSNWATVGGAQPIYQI